MFERRALGAVFALSSLLVPFFLGTVVGGIASGRVPVGNAAGDELTAWANETSVVVGLIWRSPRGRTSPPCSWARTPAGRGSPGSWMLFGRARSDRALVAGAFALAGLLVVRSDAPDLYDGLTSGAGLVCVLVSAAAGLATLALEWRGRFEAARYTVALAVAAIMAGWWRPRSPTCCPPT